MERSKQYANVPNWLMVQSGLAKLTVFKEQTKEVFRRIRVKGELSKKQRDEILLGVKSLLETINEFEKNLPRVEGIKEEAKEAAGAAKTELGPRHSSHWAKERMSSNKDLSSQRDKRQQPSLGAWKKPKAKKTKKAKKHAKKPTDAKKTKKVEKTAPKDFSEKIKHLRAEFERLKKEIE